jgi:phospholipase C
MPDFQHLIIVMMENHSFDEVFGTFPGVDGFSTASPAFSQTWGARSNNPASPPPPLLPWRMSTFTSNATKTPHNNHSWSSMHAAVHPGLTISGLTYPQGADNSGFYSAQNSNSNSGPNMTPQGQAGTPMAYYAANDIPYHWALASNFALCDRYFCSALSGTLANRLWMISGTAFPSNPSAAPGGSPVNNVYTVEETSTGPLAPPFTDNLPTQQGPPGPDEPSPDLPPISAQGYEFPNYIAALQGVSPRQGVPVSDGSPVYRVYDDWNWAWDWAQAQPAGGPNGGYGDLNVFSYYPPVNGVQLGCLGDPNYFAANYNATSAAGDNRPLLAQHISPRDGSQPVLAKVTWLSPPWNYSEHPDCNSVTMSADGGRYLSQIVDALIESQYWQSTVFVVVYDETNVNFDHVVPPLPATPEDEPWIIGPMPYAAPVGAGMRVPMIIVSPWTYGQGVISTPMDHTSLLQCVETLTGVPCTGLPTPGWRRDNFANLYDVINGLNVQAFDPAALQPPRALPTGLPTSAIAEQWWNDAQARYGANPSANPIAPVSQTWPPASGPAPGQTYFGCWLDINVSDPVMPTSPPMILEQWDGPWNGADFAPGVQIGSINQAFNADLHQCLVAEISFEGVTIPAADAPGYSSWLAQRNLAFVQS